MKWQQWNHNATLWLTPCMHSNTRFSCLGYFGNLCSNICCNCSTPAFWTRPKQLLLLWYLYWRKKYCVAGAASYLESGHSYTKLLFQYPHSCHEALYAIKSQQGCPSVITQETGCFQLYGFGHNLQSAGSAAPFTQACPSLASLWSICKFSPASMIIKNK